MGQDLQFEKQGTPQAWGKTQVFVLCDKSLKSLCCLLAKLFFLSKLKVILIKCTGSNINLPFSEVGINVL